MWTCLEPGRSNVGEPIRACAAVAESDRHCRVVLSRLDECRKLEWGDAGSGYAYDVTVNNAQALRGCRRKACVVVPRDLRHGIGQFVKPRVMAVPSVEHPNLRI